MLLLHLSESSLAEWARILEWQRTSTFTPLSTTNSQPNTLSFSLSNLQQRIEANQSFPTTHLANYTFSNYTCCCGQAKWAKKTTYGQKNSSEKRIKCTEFQKFQRRMKNKFSKQKFTCTSQRYWYWNLGTGAWLRLIAITINARPLVTSKSSSS